MFEAYDIARLRIPPLSKLRCSSLSSEFNSVGSAKKGKNQVIYTKKEQQFESIYAQFTFPSLIVGRTGYNSGFCVPEFLLKGKNTTI